MSKRQKGEVKRGRELTSGGDAVRDDVLRGSLCEIIKRLCLQVHVILMVQFVLEGTTQTTGLFR